MIGRGRPWIGICNILLDFVVLLKLEYYISGSCCWKVKVDYSQQNDAWTQIGSAFGYYEIKSGTVNGKSHYVSMFDSGKYAIWIENGQWTIGFSNNVGSNSGFAYNNNVNTHTCPYGPAWDWFYLDYFGNWQNAGRGLSIWCMS